MIYVIGLGPGGEDQMTPRALNALSRCDVIVGYKTYIDLIEPQFRGKCELVVSPMRGEVERCEDALRRSRDGHTVGLISSGDRVLDCFQGSVQSVRRLLLGQACLLCD